jgi:hypothetical protein
MALYIDSASEHRDVVERLCEAGKGGEGDRGRDSSRSLCTRFTNHATSKQAKSVHRLYSHYLYYILHCTVK